MGRYGTSFMDLGHAKGDLMFILLIIIVVLFIVAVVILVYWLYKTRLDNEKLIKMEKDIEEVKETVKELKKKWDEIE